jgi:hypothetical protein
MGLCGVFDRKQVTYLIPSVPMPTTLTAYVIWHGLTSLSCRIACMTLIAYQCRDHYLTTGK